MIFTDTDWQRLNNLIDIISREKRDKVKYVSIEKKLI